MFDSVGGGEIMLILLAILVLFGPKRIPELAQSLGKGLREFKKAQQELQDNLTKVVNSDEVKGLNESFQSLRQDMQNSVQKLTADLHGVTAVTSSNAPVVGEIPVATPPPPATDAPAATPPATSPAPSTPSSSTPS